MEGDDEEQNEEKEEEQVEKEEEKQEEEEKERRRSKRKKEKLHLLTAALLSPDVLLCLQRSSTVEMIHSGQSEWAGLSHQRWLKLRPLHIPITSMVKAWVWPRPLSF